MPGQYYCFVPFTKDEIPKVLPGEPTVERIAKQWRNDAKELCVASRKQPVLIFYGVTAKDGWKLEGFKPLTDTIYIIGHCHAGGNHLGSSRGGFRFDRAELDSKTIISRLLEYIPVEMINFKLLACFGGTHVQREENGELQFEPSFASKFYSELKKSYRAAVLTAYCLPVKGGLDAQGHKQLALADGSGYSGLASANKVKFGV